MTIEYKGKSSRTETVEVETMSMDIRIHDKMTLLHIAEALTNLEELAYKEGRIKSEIDSIVSDRKKFNEVLAGWK